jgi:hypothetical protein
LVGSLKLFYQPILEMEQAKQECIHAISASIDALMTRHRIETDLGEMTPQKYKSDMEIYHKQRIERDILLGNLPPNKKPQAAKFRNGLYIG